MRKKLAAQGIIKMICGIIALGLLLFLPAGTFRFPGAWRMLGILFVPMLILGTVLLIVKPELLAKLLNQKENEGEQKSVIFFSQLLFVACFLLCGFDFRFGWSRRPLWVSIVGCAVFLITYAGFAELLRENEYLSQSSLLPPDVIHNFCRNVMLVRIELPFMVVNIIAHGVTMKAALP